MRMAVQLLSTERRLSLIIEPDNSVALERKRESDKLPHRLVQEGQSLFLDARNDGPCNG